VIGTKIENDTWLIYEDGGDHWKAIRCDKDTFSQTTWQPTDTLVNASSMTDGLANTNKMATTAGGARAWVESKGGYLPAIDELEAIVRKQNIINDNSASPIPITGDAWSSTEGYASYAYYLHLGLGGTFFTNKTTSRWCFPIKRIPK